MRTTSRIAYRGNMQMPGKTERKQMKDARAVKTLLVFGEILHSFGVDYWIHAYALCLLGQIWACTASARQSLPDGSALRADRPDRIVGGRYGYKERMGFENQMRQCAPPLPSTRISFLSIR